MFFPILVGITLLLTSFVQLQDDEDPAAGDPDEGADPEDVQPVTDDDGEPVSCTQLCTDLFECGKSLEDGYRTCICNNYDEVTACASENCGMEEDSMVGLGCDRLDENIWV